MNLSEIIREVIDYFKSIESIRAIYVYGSFAKGKASRESDLDIAVLTSLPKNTLSKFETRMLYTAALSQATGIEVDLVFLEECSELLKF